MSVTRISSDEALNAAERLQEEATQSAREAVESVLLCYKCNDCGSTFMAPADAAWEKEGVMPECPVCAPDDHEAPF
jgi:hypothetical protein